MSRKERNVPLLLWPLVMVWRMVGWLLNLTGRLIAIVIGLVLMLVGGLIAITGIGAILGVPIFTFGLLLVARGLF